MLINQLDKVSTSEEIIHRCITDNDVTMDNLPKVIEQRGVDPLSEEVSLQVGLGASPILEDGKGEGKKRKVGPTSGYVPGRSHGQLGLRTGHS